MDTYEILQLSDLRPDDTLRPKSRIDRNTVKFWEYSRDCSKIYAPIERTADLTVSRVEPGSVAWIVASTVSEPKVRLKISERELLANFHLCR